VSRVQGGSGARGRTTARRLPRAPPRSQHSRAERKQVTASCRVVERGCARGPAPARLAEGSAKGRGGPRPRTAPASTPCWPRASCSPRRACRRCRWPLRSRWSGSAPHRESTRSSPCGTAQAASTHARSPQRSASPATACRAQKHGQLHAPVRPPRTWLRCSSARMCGKARRLSTSHRKFRWPGADWCRSRESGSSSSGLKHANRPPDFSGLGFARSAVVGHDVLSLGRRSTTMMDASSWGWGGWGVQPLASQVMVRRSAFSAELYGPARARLSRGLQLVWQSWHACSRVFQRRLCASWRLPPGARAHQEPQVAGHVGQDGSCRVLGCLEAAQLHGLAEAHEVPHAVRADHEPRPRGRQHHLHTPTASHPGGPASADMVRMRMLPYRARVHAAQEGCMSRRRWGLRELERSLCGTRRARAGSPAGCAAWE
jgi:hypothetical protein